MNSDNLKTLVHNIPKAELHVHIEGTMEPELIFKLAQRNNISLKHNSVDALRTAYNFNNLQEFLDIYYQGANVLIHQQDFYDLTMAYLRKCRDENIIHTEIFFDPQTHTHRGIALETVVKGIQTALNEALENWGITSLLIPNFLRHLSEEDAISTFKECLPFREYFAGFGLDSSELGHPPSKFERVFKMVHDEGFKVVAHAGEEGPAQNIWDSINLLGVSRIDHGVRSISDEKLMEELVRLQIPLTVCPLSNLKLKVVSDLKDHPLKKLLDAGIMATVNSDDPAYFGGYLIKNYVDTAEALDLSKKEILKLAKNSFKASFLGEHEKERWIAELGSY